MYDHKEVMLRTISYLHTRGIIVSKEKYETVFKKIKGMCLILTNICIKYSLSVGEKSKIIEKIDKILIEIETREREVVYELLLEVKLISRN